MKTKILSLLSITLVSSLLSACGGSSSSDGGLGVATIGAGNQQDLAVASSLAAAEVKDTNGVSLPVAAEAGLSENIEYASRIVKQSLLNYTLPTAVEVEGVCETGSADVSGDESRLVIFYDDCRSLEPDALINGKAIVISTGSNTTIIFENFSMVVNGITEVINATITCIADNCTISSDFYDDSGKSYRVSNSEITGSDSLGYNISATVYDSEHGEVTFNATAIQFNCSNGYPSSGNIIFTDGTTEAMVTFNSCDSYTLTVDGTADSLTW